LTENPLSAPASAPAGFPAAGASAALDRLGAARGRHREGALRFPWSRRDGLFEDLSGRARAGPALAPEAGRVRSTGVRVRGRVRARPGGDESVLLPGHRLHPARHRRDAGVRGPPGRRGLRVATAARRALGGARGRRHRPARAAERAGELGPGPRRRGLRVARGLPLGVLHPA
jgi:hypothetical protein